ncbi:MAG TPA: hypothetical protein VMZ04_04710, partial [Anaerolineae bacterium]|nr:hypothetical protein [Anaerolineae bacterium]
MAVLLIMSAVLCGIAVSGQVNDTSGSGDKSRQKLEFKAPHFSFKSLDEMNIINYSGDSARQVRAWQEDIELEANEAVYNSKLG